MKVVPTVYLYSFIGLATPHNVWWCVDDSRATWEILAFVFFTLSYITSDHHDGLTLTISNVDGFAPDATIYCLSCRLSIHRGHTL